MAERQRLPGQWVLQICHGYSGPFLDVARQYAALFQGTDWKVCTVYLTGEPSETVRGLSCSDEVLFLEQSSSQIRGLKLGAVLAIRRILASRRVRVIIAHRFKSIYAACLASGLPVIGVHHGFGDYSRLSRRLFANRFRSRLLLLGVSNAVRDEIRDQLPNWPRSQIQTLYNRIDIATTQAGLLPTETARSTLGLPPDAYVIGNVGRLHPDKDQATLIRGFALALPRLPRGSLLTILGSGRLDSELKELAKELDVADNVYFAGQVPDAKRYFRAFDSFALTSDNEPFGMVLLEAMAAGLPIVCSDCGGGREVVAGYGELFPFGDAVSLADALVRLAGKRNTFQSSANALLLERFSDTAAKSNFFEQLNVAGFDFLHQPIPDLRTPPCPQ